MHQIKAKDLVLIALFAALIAAGAFIRIPLPPVPVTLQVLFVTLAGAAPFLYWWSKNRNMRGT